MNKYKVTQTESYRWAGVDKTYIVEYDGDKEFACECKGFTYTGNCWHINKIKEELK